jgi:hypothetical protein
MVSDRDRHDLFVALHDRLGDGPADTLMALLPPVGWADVARRADVEALDQKLTARIDSLEARMEGFEAKMDGRLDALLPRLITANIASMLAVAGIVFTIARAV